VGQSMGHTKSKETKEARGPLKDKRPSSLSSTSTAGPPLESRAPVQKTGAKLSLPKVDADRWELPRRYEVKKIVGKGSYGSVCEAKDLDQSCTVAIKQVRHLFDDLVDCKRILRELAILSRLSHPNVVRLHDIVVPTSKPVYNELYIIMELCDSDMKKLVKTDVTLTPLHVNTLLYNLLVGVKYLHSAGVYHRDLKPANCLVNQDCSVKICDFGLSMAMGYSAEDVLEHPRAVYPSSPHGPIVPSNMRAKRAMTQHVVTRWYRAPELILLQKDYSHPIDIWSAGCIYAELIQMEEGGKRVHDRGPLFPGSSCYPLSPDRKSHGHRGRQEHDQLNVIFDVLGTPSSADVAQLEFGEGSRYVGGLEPRTGTGIRSKYPFASAAAIDMLERMLKFSPKLRITVGDALAHRMLMDIRDVSKETTSSISVGLAFDKESNMQEPRLRQCFDEEVKRFKQGLGEVQTPSEPANNRV